MSDAIRDLELSILQKELRRDEVVEALKDIEKRFGSEIEGLWQRDKDPMFSNAQKRADATKARMDSDAQAVSLDDERGALEIELRSMAIELSFLRREFQREMLARREALAGIGGA